MVKPVMAVILAGGEGERLSILSSVRAKPAVPFGGKYRIIDFTLSNCVNSGIDDVVVLTQYNPRSLNDHIGLGRPWDLDRNKGGVKLLQPYIKRGRVAEWYRGTADAVLQNFNVIEHDAGDTVLVLAGDHIYKMDYTPFLAAHRRHRADVTIAVRRVPAGRGEPDGRPGARRAGPRRGVAGEAQAAQERPRVDGRLRVHQAGAAPLACRTTGRTSAANVIPAMLAGGARVFGYRFDGYWQDVGTIQSFWEANMALLDDNPELDLYDREWLIHTRSEERAPAKVGPTAQVHRSLISHGCVINGTVVNSVLSPGVRVDVGAVVRDSIVMFDTRHPQRRGRGPGDPGQGGRDRPGRHRRRRTGLRHAEQGRARSPQHRDHGRRQAVRGAARHAPRAQREGRRAGPCRGLRQPHRQVRRDRGTQGDSPAARIATPTPRCHPPGRWPARTEPPGRMRSPGTD